MTSDPDHTAEPKLLSIACFPTFFPAQISPPNYERTMGHAGYHRVPETSVDLDEGLLLLDPLGNESESGDDKELGHKFTCYPTLILRLIAILVFSPAFVIYMDAGCLLATISVGFAMGRNILTILHWILCRYINISVDFKKLDHSTRNSGKLARTCPIWLKPSPFYLILDLVVIILLIVNMIIGTRIFAGFCLALVAVLLYVISLSDLGNPDNITIQGKILFNFRRGEETVAERPAQPQVQQRIFRNREDSQAGEY